MNALMSASLPALIVPPKPPLLEGHKNARRLAPNVPNPASTVMRIPRLRN
jgi:hypothetical protein